MSVVADAEKMMWTAFILTIILTGKMQAARNRISMIPTAKSHKFRWKIKARWLGRKMSTILSKRLAWNKANKKLKFLRHFVVRILSAAHTEKKRTSLPDLTLTPNFMPTRARRRLVDYPRRSLSRRRGKGIIFPALLEFAEIAVT